MPDTGCRMQMQDTGCRMQIQDTECWILGTECCIRAYSRLFIRENFVSPYSRTFVSSQFAKFAFKKIPAIGGAQSEPCPSVQWVLNKIGF